jgi:predicted Fe-Mo cluster-binding NifX family protein
MKIAITSTGTEFDSAVEPRFGRCLYFALVDTESGAFEAKANPFLDAAGGAGVQAAQWVVDQGVSALLTGGCGPRAAAVLDDADIRIIEDVAGTVREGATRYSYEGQPVTRSEIASRLRGQGYGGGFGAVQGRGRGRTQGPGTGQGAGRGRRRGQPGQGRGRGPCGGGQAWGRGSGSGGGRPRV